MTIDGVTITPLRKIEDERGAVFHMWRAGDLQIAPLGEVYFSTVYPGAVKAWKRHRKMTLNLACIAGSIQLAVFDDRPDSRSRGSVQEIVFGPEHYVLVTIAPMLWTGFRGVADVTSILCNCASLPHDPAESDRLAFDASSIPFAWKSVQ